MLIMMRARELATAERRVMFTEAQNEVMGLRLMQKRFPQLQISEAHPASEREATLYQKMLTDGVIQTIA